MRPPTLPRDKVKALRTPNNQTSSADEEAGGGAEVGSGHCSAPTRLTAFPSQVLSSKMCFVL